MSSEDQSNLKRKFSSKRRSKKKFRGVRPSEIVCQESEEQVELQLAAENVQSTKDIQDDVQGASARKFSAQIEPNFQSERVRIINMEFLQSLLDITAVCQKCKYGKLEVKEETEKKMGLASLIVAKCQQCLKRVEMYTSPNCKNSKGFEINRKAVLGAMGIGGSKRMRGAAKEEKDQETNHTECDVMLDGTWRKRGFSSLQGAVTAISAKTGKCLDFETLNKVCHGCSTWKSKPDCPEKEKWLAEHNCATNYHGSAPAMEPEGVKRIFLRSEELHQLQYTGYIGDGDSKAYNNVSSLKPYAADDRMQQTEGLTYASGSF
eukprot:gene17083-8600_t